MDLERLKALIDLAAASQLGELDVTENGYRIRIRRTTGGASAEAPAPLPAAQAEPRVAGAAVRPAARPSRAAPSREHVVVSPMYGIFHRAPSPDSPPFVAPGGAVRRGQKLCLLEAMKVFNVIEADVDGTIAEILVENGQEVELGQGLFRIAR
ncbi:MAG: acetyl-CoA carboxylase biotin carboxyl carrier protein [Alphaproteobacteria bacterium]|nr:acetyl-CoA carboxylase biotin carboxyl carrier protein [Alphaproteobacteria bacterium]